MQTEQLTWDKEASVYLLRAPFFVRGMAKRKVEKAAMEEGLSRITIEFVKKVREQQSTV